MNPDHNNTRKIVYIVPPKINCKLNKKWVLCLPQKSKPKPSNPMPPGPPPQSATLTHIHLNVSA